MIMSVLNHDDRRIHNDTKKFRCYVEKTKWFWIILAVSLIIKGIIFYKLSSYPYRLNHLDANHYNHLAANLIKFRFFGVFSPITEQFRPETIRPPGYPAFLAAINRCTPDIYSLSDITVLIQIVLSSLTCGLVYLLSKRLLNQTAAITAGLLSVLDITSSVFANTLLSDTLFAFLFFFSLYLLITGIIDHKNSRLLSAGFFLGLASLCRSIALYTVLIFLLFFIYFRKEIPFFKGVIFLLPFSLLIVSWKARNYLQTGTSVFSTQPYIFMVDVASDTKSKVDKKPFNETRTSLKRQIMDMFERERIKSDNFKETRLAEWEMIITDPLVQRLCTTIFWDQIITHPNVFLKNYLANLVIFMVEPDSVSYYWYYTGSPFLHVQWSLAGIRRIFTNHYRLSLFLISQVVLFILLWGGFIWGTVAMLSSEKRKWSILLMAIVLYFTLVTTMAHIEMRYRIPVIPILSMGAGFGLWNLIFKNRQPS